MVRAISPTDDRYSSANSQVTIRVERANQRGFAFAEDIITKTYGEASFTIPISGGESTGQVTYKVTSGQDIVSIDRTSGRITLLRAGRATVTATKAADSKYNAADATIDILVEKAVPPPVIFPVADPIAYGQKLSDSLLSMGSGDGTFTWGIPDTIPNAGVGSYTVVFIPNDTDNFDYTNITLRQKVPLAVRKAPQVPLNVNGIPGRLIFGNGPFRLNVHGGSGTGRLSYAIISGSAVTIDAAGKVRIIHPGETTIRVTNSGDENYLPTSYEFLLVVDKAAQANTGIDVSTDVEEEPSESPTPSEPPPQDDTSAPVKLKTLSIHAEEETGKLVLAISIDDLPEGATAIRLPSGEILQIDTRLNSLELSISRKDINEAGELVLVALNKENKPMGSYVIDLSDVSWQSGTSNGRTGFGSMDSWMAAGVLVIGGGITTTFIVLRKKKR